MKFGGNWSLPVMLRASVRYIAGAICVCCLLFMLGCGSDIATDVESSDNDAEAIENAEMDPAAVDDTTDDTTAL